MCDREGVGDADEVSDGDDVDGVGDNDGIHEVEGVREVVGKEEGLGKGEAHCRPIATTHSLTVSQQGPPQHQKQKKQHQHKPDSHHLSGWSGMCGGCWWSEAQSGGGGEPSRRFITSPLWPLCLCNLPCFKAPCINQPQ